MSGRRGAGPVATGAAAWMRFVAGSLRRNPVRAVTLVAGVVIASTAFAVLSGGVFQDRLLAGSSGVDWARAAALTATWTHEPDRVHEGTVLAVAALDGVASVAPIEVLGTTGPSGGTGAAGEAAAIPSGFLVVGISPSGQARATGLASDLRWGQYLGDDTYPLDRAPAATPTTPAPAAAAAPLRALVAVRGDGRAAVRGEIDSLHAAADAGASTILLAPAPVEVVGEIAPAALQRMLLPAGGAPDASSGALVLTVPDAERLAGRLRDLGGPRTAAFVVQVSDDGGAALRAARSRGVAEALLLSGGLRVVVDGHRVHLTRVLDAQSGALVVLLLLVGLIFVVASVAATVARRRDEMALLSRIGWSARRVVALVGGEYALLGIAAAVLAALLATVLPSADGAPAAVRAVLAPAVALVLTLGGSIVAAAVAITRRRRASGAPAHAGRVRTLPALAASALRRRPARTLVSGAGVALGLFAVTAVWFVAVGYGGGAVGELAGQPVAVRVGALDLPTALTVLALGCLGLADMTAANLFDRRAEIGTLSILGWSRRLLVALTVGEAALVSVAAATVGAVLAMSAAIVLFGPPPPAAVGGALGIAAGAALVATLTAWAAVVAARLDSRRLRLAL